MNFEKPEVEPALAPVLPRCFSNAPFLVRTAQPDSGPRRCHPSHGLSRSKSISELTDIRADVLWAPTVSGC